MNISDFFKDPTIRRIMHELETDARLRIDMSLIDELERYTRYAKQFDDISHASYKTLADLHGLAAESAQPLLDAGPRVIDLSADFRLKDETVYSASRKSSTSLERNRSSKWKANTWISGNPRRQRTRRSDQA